MKAFLLGMLVFRLTIPGVFDIPIIQQPEDHPEFVSSYPNVITQFSLATESIGLLAHNDKAGSYFGGLMLGDELVINRTETFIVTSIEKYEALDPSSPHSDFINLQSRERLTAYELFEHVYAGEYHLVLQTCIKYRGNPSWGRLFIIAYPKERT